LDIGEQMEPVRDAPIRLDLCRHHKPLDEIAPNRHQPVKQSAEAIIAH
jgi:hypothetical protein